MPCSKTWCSFMAVMEIATTFLRVEVYKADTFLGISYLESKFLSDLYQMAQCHGITSTTFISCSRCENLALSSRTDRNILAENFILVIFSVFKEKISAKI